MEIPDLVREALGDEEIQAGVSLGDEDTVCFTPTRTIVYRGEGLLSDEDVSEFPHDFERLAVSEGRRKTKFSLTYVDDKREFAVPGNRTDPVLERLLESALRVGGTLADDEGLAGVFRFSELTLLVADRRLLKHVGEYTWEEDHDGYHYDDVTGLDFEEGSVATAIVLEVDGRPQRMKAPNDQAALFRKTLEDALFEYHGVESLAEFNRAVTPTSGDPAGDDADEAGGDSSGGLGLDSDIDPLVGGDAGGETAADPGAGASGERRRQSSTGGSADRGTATGDARGRAAATETREQRGDQRAGSVDADLAAVEDQLATLTEAVQQQNELLERQQQTIKQLIQELRQGR